MGLFKSKAEKELDVRDVMQGLAVIDLFEWEDEGNEVYTPGSYDVVDDDENSLIHRS